MPDDRSPIMPELELKRPSWARHGSDEIIPHAFASYMIHSISITLNVEDSILTREYLALGDAGSNFERLRKCPVLHGKTDALIEQAILAFRIGINTTVFRNRTASLPFGSVGREPGSMTDAERTLAVDKALAVQDDPVNPKHYAGTACAEIGELLTANSYQVLKYNWRLGKKDDAYIELGKSLWYLDREIVMVEAYNKNGTLFAPMLPLTTLPKSKWFDERLKDQDEWVRAVAWLLIDYNLRGDIGSLLRLRAEITTKRTHMECGSGLAI